MSHNICLVNGRASMMYVREAPWHGLGTRLEQPATAAEAIEAAGLGFTVEKRCLHITDPDTRILGHFATLRTDTNDVLGVVGARYVPIQNRDAFSAFDALVGEGEAIYHTAGVLGKGERIWILAKLPNYIRVGENDIVEEYLLLVNAHDGSSAVRMKLTPIRVVCENTLAVALSGGEREIRIRHTADSESQLQEAHKILGFSNVLFRDLGEVFAKMRERELKREEVKRYFKGLFPDPPHRLAGRAAGIRESVEDLFENGTGSELAGRSLWGAYNAVTEYVDHMKSVTVDNSTRLQSLWFGWGEHRKREAFKAALAILI